jgi:hypothetical protein
MISAVADDDFLGRRLDSRRRDIREALDACGAEEAVFVAERLAGVADEFCARTVDEPQVAGLRIDADGVDDVRLAADDALVTSGDDLGRFGEAGGSGDQRSRQERLDVARRNCRDGLVLEGCHPYFRRHAHGIQCELRLAVYHRQADDVARVDPVRIADLLAIHPPDIGPAPRILEKLARDAPQRVAFLHRVARRCIIGGLHTLRRRRCGQRQNGQEGKRGLEALGYGKVLTHMASLSVDGLANVLNRHKIRT